ncbi:MAG TPA: response regulator transcription factor [Chloroflexota bacterium]|jgi:DNA-binding response OmpR family regulator|nr:response regulator transcription factor [Chloroflexota bacterium]
MPETKSSSGTILLVEDDASTAEALTAVLTDNGYTVWHAQDGAQAKAMLEEAHPDLVVLDLMLPDTDGLVLCANLKAIADVPIVICSGTVRKRDTILGFKLGADDFIAKPFDIAEFEARIQAVLRRRQTAKVVPAAQPADQIALGPLSIDRARSRVMLDEQPIQLTRTEFRILQALAARPDEILSRDELSQMLWGRPEPPGSRAIDMHVRRLRVKLGQGEGAAPLIVSVRGFGYKIMPPEQYQPAVASIAS